MQPAIDTHRALEGLHPFFDTDKVNGATHARQALIISSEAHEADGLETIFHFLGFEVAVINAPSQLEKLLSSDLPPDVLCISASLDAVQQEQWVSTIAKHSPQMKPIVIGASRSINAQATRALFPDSWLRLSQPVDYRSLSEALAKASAHRDNYRSRPQQDPQMFRSLVGNSVAIQRIRRAIEQVAPTDANVLILGESGTGKEVVARNIHLNSKRRAKPFVPVNCGAIPHDLLESELFGHEKGAFTGALSARQGRFAMAEGGTLFLDEIGDMPMDMQVKLLRVLEERTYERVGSNQSHQANVRILAATNCNLEQFVKDGKFREDLYFRLEVFPIDLPPLRERIDDLPMLIEHLSARLEQKQQPSVRFSKEAIMHMAQYAWPGNVRELANIIERMAIQYPYGLVQPSDLPRKLYAENLRIEPAALNLDTAIEPISSNGALDVPRLPDTGMDLKNYIAEVEISLINQALDDADGIIAHAADLLGLRRTTLTEKMRKYGINRGKA